MIKVAFGERILEGTRKSRVASHTLDYGVDDDHDGMKSIQSIAFCGRLESLATWQVSKVSVILFGTRIYM